MSGHITIDKREFVERYRYVCPHEHTSWEWTQNHFWCPACWKSSDEDPKFYYLKDMETGESLHRGQVEVKW